MKKAFKITWVENTKRNSVVIYASSSLRANLTFLENYGGKDVTGVNKININCTVKRL